MRKAGVYLITDGDWTKIGVAQDYNQRLKVLQLGNPRKLELVEVIGCSSTSEAVIMERMLHRHFAEYRGFTEWFNIPVSTILEIVPEMRLRIAELPKQQLIDKPIIIDTEAILKQLGYRK